MQAEEARENLKVCREISDGWHPLNGGVRGRGKDRDTPASGCKVGLIRVWSTKAPRSFWKKRDKLFVCWVCGARGLLGDSHVNVF